MCIILLVLLDVSNVQSVYAQICSHLTTYTTVQVLCKIDGVDTNGSDELRKIRRRTVRKAEDVASRSEQQKD